MSSREQFNAAITAARLLSGIGLAVSAAIMLLNLAGTMERLKQVGWRGLLSTTIRRSFVSLFMLSLMATIVMVINVCMVNVDFTAQDMSCNQLIGALVGCFVTTKQFLFLFLYFRAQIVHDALKLNDFKVDLLRKSILFNITLGVPLAFGWTYFLVFFGEVTPEGPCLMVTVTEASVIAFAVCDAVTSGTLLMLFVLPLKAHAKQVKSTTQDEDRKLGTVIRRNLVLGSLVIFTSLCGLIAVVVFQGLRRTNTGNAHHLQVLASLFPALELVWSVIVSHTLTRAWLPSALRRIFKVSAEDQHRLTSPIVSSPPQYATSHTSQVYNHHHHLDQASSSNGSSSPTRTSKSEQHHVAVVHAISLDDTSST